MVGGKYHDSVRYQARIEAGLKSFLVAGDFNAFTTTFQDLHGLKQLPGLAAQRLMAEGFGFGAEYITAWHLALYGSFGFIPSGNDADFDGIQLAGGTGWKAGLNYYLFPKNPLHLGLSVSYGTVYYDHDIVADATNDFTRELITTMGYQFDVLVTYLSDEWYFLQFAVGMYYAPNAHDDSFKTDITTGAETSRVVNKDGIPKWGLVFGITIGFALPEFFPDDTEKRRREREKRNDD